MTSADDLHAFRELMEERDRRYNERFASQEEAVRKAFEAKTEHDRITNGLLELLRNAQSGFLTKEEYERRHIDLVAKIDALWDFRTNVSGRETTLKWVWAIIVALAGITVGHFWK